MIIAIIILAASMEFYLVGCTSNPEPDPLDELDQSIIASILAGPVKNQSTTSTPTEISTSTPNISIFEDTTMDTITTTIQTTSLETDVIEEPLKLNQLEQKAPGNQLLPIAGNMVWPYRAFSVNEKMILITIAVVAFEVMAYRFIERAFDKLNHPENCILGQSLVEHAV